MDENGTAWLNVEDVARGLGFTQTQNKGGKIYTSIMWWRVLVFIQNDQAITTSLKVAETFDKNHRHVLDSIRDLIKQIDNEPKNGRVKMFEESSYVDKKGESRPMYLMKRLFKKLWLSRRSCERRFYS